MDEAAVCSSQSRVLLIWLELKWSIPEARDRAQVLTCMHWLDPASMQRFSFKGLALSKQLICSNADDSPMTFDLGMRKATGVQLDIISQHVTELQQWRGWLLSTKKKNDNIVIYNCPSGIKEMTSCSAKRKKTNSVDAHTFPFEVLYLPAYSLI